MYFELLEMITFSKVIYQEELDYLCCLYPACLSGVCDTVYVRFFQCYPSTDDSSVRCTLAESQKSAASLIVYIVGDDPAMTKFWASQIKAGAV